MRRGRTRCPSCSRDARPARSGCTSPSPRLGRESRAPSGCTYCRQPTPGSPDRSSGRAAGRGRSDAAPSGGWSSALARSLRPHQPHQPLHPSAVDLKASTVQLRRHRLGAVKRRREILLVNPPPCLLAHPSAPPRYPGAHSTLASGPNFAVRLCS